jgi:crossover junction endodeoxyribonuclease RuvC
MIILGIDPGTIVMGYGLIESDDGEVIYIDCGVINTPSRSPIGERLSFIYNNLSDIIKDFHPDIVAIEQPFVSKNIKSAFSIGRAQAIGILVAANNGIPVFEYTPTQIKQQVTSYGASSKEQVQEMIRLQLGLTTAPKPFDAADALAVALCHLSETHISNLIGKR